MINDKIVIENKKRKSKKFLL